MESLENRLININCLRKNAIQGVSGDSSDSVVREGSDNLVRQMPTAELIKVKKPCSSALTQPLTDSSDVACVSSVPGVTNMSGAGLELVPAKKKMRIRECSDLRHWWDEESAPREESFECA